MEVEMPANVFAPEAGTKEQRWCVEGTASADDSFRANTHAVAAFRTRFDAGCRTGFDPNAKGARLDHESSAMLLRIREPGFRRRLFCTKSAAVATVTANFSLIAADHIAGHRVDVPPESAQAAIQNLFTAGDAIVVTIDVQSFADRVQAARILVAREPRHSRSGPFGSNVVGGSKRRAVINDGRAAEAFSCKQAYAVIGSGGKARFGIEPLKTTELGAVEVVVIVITAGLKNDHVLSRSTENSSGGAATGAGTHDANFTRQIHLAIRHRHFEGMRQRSLWRTERTGIGEILPDFAAASVLRRQHDVEKTNCLAKCLECGAALTHPTVCPGKQDANAAFLGKMGKGLQTADGEKAVEARIPVVKKLKKLCAIPWARVEIHRRSDGFGDTQFQCGRPALHAWQKRFAKGFECALLSKSEIQSFALALTSFQFLLLLISSSEAPFLSESLLKRESGKPGLNLQVS